MTESFERRADAASVRPAKHAWRIRRFALRMGKVLGQGYVGQALGWADILAATYRHAMNIRAEEPEWGRA
jgi:transketolase